MTGQLAISGLSVRFRDGHEERVLLEDISLTLNRGEILGLVGESGSGKTTAGRSVLRLVEPTSGQVELGGKDVIAMAPGELRRQARRQSALKRRKTPRG